MNKFLQSVFDGSDDGPKGHNFGPLPEWDLSDLYGSMQSGEIAHDLKASEDMAVELAATYQGRIAEISGGAAAAVTLAKMIGELEDLSDVLGRVASYAQLLFTKESTNPANAKFYGDISEKVTSISTKILFISLELNDIDDERLEALMQTPELERLRPWLINNRIFKPYQLSSEVEQLLNEKSSTSSQSWVRLFDETRAGWRCEFRGEEITFEEVVDFLSHKDAALRAEAGAAVAKVLSDNSALLSLITNTLAKDKSIDDKLRQFPDLASGRHLANQVEAEVVEALVGSVKAAYPKLSHRYYALKAKWLGVEALNYWDRNAPLPENSDDDISWSEAKDIVLKAYDAFSPEMARIAAQFFDKGWIDAPVTPGKSGGAFAHPTVPSVHPYVLVNYQGKPRDVMTLAHELGHGVHQVLAAEQGPLLADTPLTLAETASVFGEMLTFQSLLAKAETPKARKILLASKVEDMINTVVRQIAFYDFERRIHSARLDGELTPEDIGRIWLDVQAESLGPAMKQNDGFEVYWSQIPHFIHSPFYVYAYAFGDCLVNSLFAVYQGAPQGFQEKYFDMLKAGGSLRHKELLAPFGLDASRPDFWTQGLNLIESMIDELETL